MHIVRTTGDIGMCLKCLEGAGTGLGYLDPVQNLELPCCMARLSLRQRLASLGNLPLRQRTNASWKGFSAATS